MVGKLLVAPWLPASHLDHLVIVGNMDTSIAPNSSLYSLDGWYDSNYYSTSCHDTPVIFSLYCSMKNHHFWSPQLRGGLDWICFEIQEELRHIAMSTAGSDMQRPSFDGSHKAATWDGRRVRANANGELIPRYDDWGGCGSNLGAPKMASYIIAWNPLGIGSKTIVSLVIQFC